MDGRRRHAELRREWSGSLTLRHSGAGRRRPPPPPAGWGETGRGLPPSAASALMALHRRARHTLQLGSLN